MSPFAHDMAMEGAAARVGMSLLFATILHSPTCTIRVAYLKKFTLTYSFQFALLKKKKKKNVSTFTRQITDRRPISKEKEERKRTNVNLFEKTRAAFKHRVQRDTQRSWSFYFIRVDKIKGTFTT